LEALEDRCCPSGGGGTTNPLDTTFNSAGPQPGTVVTSIDGYRDQAHALAIYPATDPNGNGGKIVAVGTNTPPTDPSLGYSNSDFALARYTSSGVLDTTFGSGGIVTTDFSSGGDQGNSVALDSSGRIIVAGASWHTVNGVITDEFALARYTENGLLDTTFGTDGEILTRFYPGSNGSSLANAVAVDAQGNILVAGGVENPNNSAFGLARYTSSGALDTSFGGNSGVPGLAVAFNGGTANAIAIQPDGAIVVAGNGGSGLGVARFSSTGSLDATFGTGGAVSTPITAATGVALDGNGNIVVSTYKPSGSGTGPEFAAVRYTTVGALDSTFGSGGIATIDFGRKSEGYATAVVIQPSNGKIVLAGYISGPSVFALARLNTNGTLDTTFGTKGKIITTFVASLGGQGFGLALQADGKIVAAGYAYSATNFAIADFALARYLGDPITANVALASVGTAAPTGIWFASDAVSPTQPVVANPAPVTEVLRAVPPGSLSAGRRDVAVLDRIFAEGQTSFADPFTDGSVLQGLVTSLKKAAGEILPRSYCN
jgi:uncharacterized delta-60 repeat protein